MFTAFFCVFQMHKSTPLKEHMLTLCMFCTLAGCWTARVSKPDSGLQLFVMPQRAHRGWHHPSEPSPDGFFFFDWCSEKREQGPGPHWFCQICGVVSIIINAPTHLRAERTRTTAPLLHAVPVLTSGGLQLSWICVSRRQSLCCYFSCPFKARGQYKWKSSCAPPYRQRSPEYLITSSSRMRRSDCACANTVQREGLISEHNRNRHQAPGL